MNHFINLLNSTLTEHTFISCIWSNPRKADGYKKMTAKWVTIHDALVVQFAMNKDNKEFHENIETDALKDFILKNGMGFKQIQLFTTTSDYHILVNKKGETHIKTLPPSKAAPTSIAHNRQKKYLLDTSSSVSFLKALGLMDNDGQIKPSKYDKYKQINRYLEIVSDTLDVLPQAPLHIVDFGCGKSYLTFALYHYLNTILGRQVEVIGLDLKQDVIAFCNELATKLDYRGLKFQVGDIGNYTTNQPIDMVVSLHACNTATDSALAQAVTWGTKVILAVPCCHHEAYPQINHPLLEPVLKHGILKERIAALVTDGLRASLLEALGYKVTVMEFIDMEHTPKNILIKAILKHPIHLNTTLYKDYQALCDMLHLNLSLEKGLNSILRNNR